MSWGTREQAADHYDCSLSTIDRARKEGKLRSSRELGRVKVELIHPDEFYGIRLEKPAEYIVIKPQKRKQKLDIPLEEYDRRYLKGDSAVAKKRQRWNYRRKGVWRRKGKKGNMWYFWYYDENGKRKFLSVPDATCREDAIIAMETKAEEVKGTKNGVKSIIFRKFAPIYLEKYAKRKKRSWKTDEKFINARLVPYFGDMLLTEITPEHVSDFIQEFKPRRKGLVKVERVTIEKHLQVLSRIHIVAKKFGYETGENPVDRELHFTAESQNVRDRVLEREEEPGLRREAAPHIESMIDCAILQLMRLEEILGLLIDDLDFEQGTIRIRPEINKTGKLDIIPMRTKIRQVFKRLIAENNGRSKFLFNYYDPRNGKYRPIKSIQHGFQAACRRANIKGLQFRDLRRTGATRLHEENVNPLLIQQLLRHSSFKLSGKVYIQSSLKLLKETLDEVDEREQKSLTGESDLIQIWYKRRKETNPNAYKYLNLN
ncbi:MAG: site-specific integrase [Candidatus Aminicenantes bacterium]|nr:MAG: site-specific integrase [Candidatus Aminicenantes bacterium]